MNRLGYTCVTSQLLSHMHDRLQHMYTLFVPHESKFTQQCIQDCSNSPCKEHMFTYTNTNYNIKGQSGPISPSSFSPPTTSLSTGTHTHTHTTHHTHTHTHTHTCTHTHMHTHTHTHTHTHEHTYTHTHPNTHTHTHPNTNTHMHTHTH